MNQSYPSCTNTNQSPSRRLEMLITGLGLVGLILFLRFYDRAFPAGWPR